MISVIVYGRNDSHGYNLQQRATLSLNSIAESLTDPDDEIVFVDWNSDVGLPTFPVTIDDVLTDHCKNILRIIRVSTSQHDAFAQGRTRKPTIEPVARNVGIRRANPRNPWILSTNTDVLLKVNAGSLSSIAATLEGHYYATPRFELPEWVWESLPRHDPMKAAGILDSHLGGAVPLSIVGSSPANLFDAPGDFQLVRRQALESIGCFDETMILGWHVDSNLAVRMESAFGNPESLEEVVSAFHCNHTRQTTHFHARGVQSNDLKTYVSEVVSPVARSGEHDWGLPAAELEIENLQDFASRLQSVSGVSAHDPSKPFLINFMDQRDRLAGVNAEISFPFLIDQLLTCRRSPLLYFGGRSDMKALLEDACQRLGSPFFQGVDFSSLEPAAEPVIVVLDLVPPREVLLRRAGTLQELCVEDKRDLLQAFEQFRTLLVDSELPAPTFRFMFINAEANEFEFSLSTAFNMLPSQFYSGVRFGTLQIDIPRGLKSNKQSTPMDVSSLLRVIFILSKFRSWARKEMIARPRLKRLLMPLIYILNRAAKVAVQWTGRYRAKVLHEYFLLVPDALSDARERP